MGLATYLTIKLIGMAHDNTWKYLGTGWGALYIFEIGVGVILPLLLFSFSIRHKMIRLVRFSALLTLVGIVMNHPQYRHCHF